MERMCNSMTNYAVLKTFSNEHVAYTSDWNLEAINQAKKRVSSLDATFFLGDFDRLPTAFVETFPPFSGKCELGHLNQVHDCPTCATEPTAAETELIEQHNQMDIMLYNYAQGLPNRKG